MRKNVGFTAVMIICLLSLSRAHATVWYVHPDSALCSIQGALDICSTDDTVLVAPGTYFENLLWPNTQGIDLISEFGSDITIIDGTSAGSVIEIFTGVDITTVIIGFTIQHGRSLSGGGIFCGNNSSPAISGNIITNNEADSSGGGISCYSSSPAINNNTILANRADSIGGGVSCTYFSSPTITGNIITGNTVDQSIFGWGFGGGIYCHSTSLPIISENIITMNTARFGGGIWCNWYSSPTITGNTITGNTARWGGGIVTGDNASIIIGNTIAQNTAEDFGGGIYCGSTSATIMDNIITGNTAGLSGYGFGGGIYCILSPSPTITGNTITNNAAIVAGGVFCSLNSTPTIDSCTISNNIDDGVFSYWGASPVIHYNNITGNAGYGVQNRDATVMVDAEHNWWGDSTGPYHFAMNPGGLGDSVSDYVDFDPWLYNPWGVEEQLTVKTIGDHNVMAATIFSGPMRLPKDKECKVFDITGRVVEPDKIQPGIYFIEVDGVVIQKVVKVR
jgi:predicted outer membrane repeat protein